MILNHKAAIELLIDNAEAVSFNRFTLLNIHSALSETCYPTHFDEGRLRTHIVEIGGSVYKPMSSEEALGIQFDAILTKANQIEDPLNNLFSLWFTYLIYSHLLM